MATKNGMRPIHPGEILREEFAKPLGLSANAIARALRVPPNRVTALLNEERSITGDTAIRLAAYLGTTEEFWMHLQAAFDLRSLAPVAKAIAAEVAPLERESA